MQTLNTNITQLLKDAGRNWIDQLPKLIDHATHLWGLSDLTPIPNMTWHYVALAHSKQFGPVVLKIAADASITGQERIALQHFADHGMVDVCAHDSEHHMLLLAQAVPGTTMKSTYLADQKTAINHYANLVKRMSEITPSAANEFKTVAQWLEVFDRVNASQLPDGYHQWAVSTSKALVSNLDDSRLLHGDLHQDNVIQQDDSWIAIDPKGVIGETAFEVAAFDYIHAIELGQPDWQQKFEGRTQQMASALNIDHQRLVQWILVRLLMGASWMIEDQGDPTHFIDLFGHFKCFDAMASVL